MKTKKYASTSRMYGNPPTADSGNSYFCDPVNGDMNNTGTSEAAAWGSLTQLFSNAKRNSLAAGDTVYLMTGAHGKPYMAIVFPDYVKFQGLDGHTPKLSGVSFGAAEHYHFDNIKFTADGSGGSFSTNFIGTAVNMKYLKVTNCDISLQDDSSSWTKADWDANTKNKAQHAFRIKGDHFYFTDNHLYNVYFGLVIETRDDVVISNNLIEKFGADGMQIQNTSNLVIDNNVIKDAYIEDYGVQHDDGIQLMGLQADLVNVRITNNKVYNISRPVTQAEFDDNLISYKFQGIILTDGHTVNCVIENNLVVSDIYHGITLNSSENSRIQNNTIIKNPNSINPTGGQTPGIRLYEGKGGTHVNAVVRNNISYLMDLGSGSYTEESNIIMPEGSEANYYTDVANYDTTTKAGSPAIDAGTNTDLSTYDIDGGSRLVGAKVDVGAYEYGSSEPVDPPLVLPTNGMVLGDKFYNKKDEEKWVYDGSAWIPWNTSAGVEEAPVDGKGYVRKSKGWIINADGIADAPSDGKQYGREDAAWTEIVGGGSGGSGTGLEFIDGKGWRLVGQDDHTVIGTNAVDLATGSGAFVGPAGTSALTAGNSTYAPGNYSVAIGNWAKATGNYALALGNGVAAEGTSAVALGGSAKAMGTSTTAIGTSVVATAVGMIALGSFNTDDADSLVEVGFGVDAENKANNFKIDTAGKVFAPAMTTALISAEGSTSKILLTKEYGDANYGGGGGGIPDAPTDGKQYGRQSATWTEITGGGGGTSDHTMLSNIGTTTHDQIDTHIADTNTHFADVANNGISYVRQNKAWVESASGVGGNTGLAFVTDTNSGWRLVGQDDHVPIGENAMDMSVGTGIYVGAGGNHAFSSGNSTFASGDYSVAMGNWAKARGNYSIGIGNGVAAEGKAAIALGWNSQAYGESASALGTGLIVTKNHMVALGEYNLDETDSSLEIGAGIDTDNRANVFKINTAGKVFTPMMTSALIAEESSASKILITKEYAEANYGGGGTSDHTTLSNIGSKSHATLDSEVDANTAKVSFPEVSPDGKLYARKDAAWSEIILTTGDTGPQGVQGVQGVKGDSGSDGTDGSPGTQGPQGTVGLKGDSGDTGDTGAQGLEGAQGVKGDPGTAGAKGDQGVQGVKGNDGTAGNEGAQGIQGIPGTAGSAGTGVTIKGSATYADIILKNGTAGDMWILTDTTGDGDAGDGMVSDGGGTGVSHWQNVGPIKGEKGDTGAQGGQGTQGTKGDTGDQGLQGIKGDDGDVGSQGSQGIQGSQGVKGDPGTTGADGGTGLKGDTGEQGTPGAKGDAGDTGSQGIQGVPGNVGADSVVPGPKGDKGDAGADGGQGIQGEPGTKGDAGDTGIQGVQGTKGDAGADSTVEGPQGNAGPTGPTGPGTATGGTSGQVLAKIDGTDFNTEWVNQSGGVGGGTGLERVTDTNSGWRLVGQNNHAPIGLDAVDLSIGEGAYIGAGGRTSFSAGNATYAAGDYSVSMGNWAKSTAGFAVSIGNAATAEAKAAVGIGWGSKALGQSSVAIGTNAYATAPGLVALGMYNLDEADSVFEVGFGVSGAEANAFKIDTDGVAISPNTTPAEIDARGDQALLTKGSGFMRETAGTTSDVGKIWTGTQAEYDLLTPNDNTLYFVI